MAKYYNNRIIVLDGADGVGKTTQIELLKNKYENAEFMKFPNYDSDTGFFITKYLNGEMNDIFKDLNYLDKINKISMLYTMDRNLWFKKYYNRFNPLICDRYTTSNIIHMGALILYHGGTINDVFDYIDRMETLEYITLDIPRPDIVIYLDAPTEQLKINLNGANKTLDIHENEEIFKNIEVMKKEVFKYCGWTIINCVENGKFKTKEEIHKEITKITDKIYESSVY